MSKMLTNVRSVVKDVSNRATQWEVIFEGITNSIHANASHITCKLTESQKVLASDDGGEMAPRKVSRIEIEDDGDGFDDENYSSFGQYRSDHKLSFGCKGVGRFVFLKVYKKVKYTSYLASLQKRREFVFSFDFDSDELREEELEIDANKTTLSLSDVTPRLLDVDRRIDRRLDLNIDDIREKVLEHLVPTLFFCKGRGHHVTIDFTDSASGDTVSITEGDIPAFATKEFTVVDSMQRDSPFSLHYYIASGGDKLRAFYCASGRTVCQFSERRFRPSGFSGWFLVESDHLNDRVNNDRNDFDIFPIRTDLFAPLSWEMINSKLKDVITDLIHTEIPEAVERNKRQLREIQIERPYLVQYIDEGDLRIAGFIGKKQIIEKAKRRFDDAKENLLAHANKDEYSDEDLREAIQIAQNELIAYVQDRVLIVQRLKTMLEDKEKSELVIHNLFMQRYTDDSDHDYFSSERNNLWLLDDRFTSYSYAASEKRIGEILGQDGSGNDDDRPDLALFFSQNPSDKKGLKSVIVELKSFSDDSKSDRVKYGGVHQLIDYVRAFQTKEEIEEIWAFLVTDVDGKLATRLEIDGFTPLFSTQTPIYHRFYEKLRASIYVVGARSLVHDAEARNRVFMDIINKQSQLSKYFEPASE